MSYVYIKSEGGSNPLYTVGFYDPRGDFRAESDHSSRDVAARRVHFLNGGRADPMRTGERQWNFHKDAT